MSDISCHVLVNIATFTTHFPLVLNWSLENSSPLLSGFRRYYNELGDTLESFCVTSLIIWCEFPSCEEKIIVICLQ
jgi:hypothetical protein